MGSINEILDDVLKDIVPTLDELSIITEIIELTEALLKKRAKEIGIDYTVIEPQGSTGIKQTQLRNDFDVDIFIGLNYDFYKPNYVGLSKNKLKKESKKDFLRLCNDWLIKALTLKEFHDPRLLYAEHPYVTVDFIDKKRDIEIKFDIVLYFELPLEYIQKNGPITAVDRSPWHGRFVRDNLNNKKKDDVRLLKQFFKCCHSYGDKSALGKMGFIGYSAELLIYHFGTIQNLFEQFSTLYDKPLDYFKRDKIELNKIRHFQNDYLIITDPVDKNRNVASAISEMAYKFCNQRVTEFLKNPSIDFFQQKPIPESPLIDSDNFYVVELKNTEEEKHYTINRDKLYSLGDSIKVNGEKEYSHAERFSSIHFGVYFEDDIQEFNLAIYCEKPNISPSFLRKGPPVHEKTHVDKFKEKNPDYIEKDGFLWVDSKRKFNLFINYLNDFVKNRLPDNLTIVNISKSKDVKTKTGKKALYALKNMILPFYLS